MIVTPSFILPSRLLAKAFEVVRIFKTPLFLINKLAPFLASRI